MKNPVNLVITTPDYDALEADGVTPHVSRLIVISTPTVPAGDPVEVNIGKPAADPDGAVRYSLAGTELIDTIVPRGGAGTFQVVEEGPGGRSAVSNTLNIERETDEATPVIGFE